MECGINVSGGRHLVAPLLFVLFCERGGHIIPESCDRAWPISRRNSVVLMQIAQRRPVAILALLVFVVPTPAALRPQWRTVNERELRKIIPARASVVKENIETELRTASGVTDGHGKFIAGVVIITAGYSAEGKYSHFFITQVPLQVGNVDLTPGQYVFGYQRTDNDTIRISFYRASTGEAVGDVDAHINRRTSMVRSLWISPPVSGKAMIQIGRFIVEYRITK
jgi:hypothetical protein